MTRSQITWTISTAAAAVALIASSIALWPVIGWTTPNRHNNDFVVAINELKEFRDEWKCDEYDEELLDLEHDKALARTDAERIEIQHKIDKLKAKMSKLECSRFEDFG